MVNLLEHMIKHCMEIFEVRHTHTHTHTHTKYSVSVYNMILLQIPTEIRVVADSYVKRRGTAQSEVISTVDPKIESTKVLRLLFWHLIALEGPKKLSVPIPGVEPGPPG